MGRPRCACGAAALALAAVAVAGALGAVAGGGELEAGGAAPPPAPLGLCDCYLAPETQEGGFAEEAPGLACERDGYFLAGFEEEDQPPEVTTKQRVPISRGVCCRPCPPPGPVAAVVGTACAPTKETRASAIYTAGPSCPVGGLVQGFLSAGHVLASHKHYPIGGTECCTPAALGTDGEIQGLHPCECSVSPDHTSCFASSAYDTDAQRLAKAKAGGRVIAAFAGAWRTSPSVSSHYVPLGPVTCCNVCAGSAPPEPEPCEALEFCSGHGTCQSSGRCICDSRWEGAACNVLKPHSGMHADLPVAIWALGLMVLAGASLGCCGHCLAFLCVSRRSRRSRNTAEALLERLAEVEEGMNRHREEGEEEEDEWNTEDEESDPEESLGPPLPEAQLLSASLRAAAGGSSEAEAAEDPTDDEEAGVEDDEEAARAPSRGKEADEEELQDCAAGDLPDGPQKSLDCVVCMSDTVSMVLVPCGHACACEDCSRRLRRCPMCRVTIKRRQKLFLSGGSSA